MPICYTMVIFINLYKYKTFLVKTLVLNEIYVCRRYFCALKLVPENSGAW